MMQAPGLVWDACCLLNLMATQHAPEILAVFDCPSYVVRELRQTEVLYLRPLPGEDPEDGLATVDLEPLLNARALLDIELTADELPLFVGLAATLDDGEARSLAIAAARGLWLVTDDRPSLRVAGERSVRSLTTPDWLRFWAERRAIDRPVLTEAMRRIETCASYRPRRVHPLRAWWEEHSS